MKLSDIKESIDAYFERITPEEVIESFKKMGVEFEPLPEDDDENNLETP